MTLIIYMNMIKRKYTLDVFLNCSIKFRGKNVYLEYLLVITLLSGVVCCNSVKFDRFIDRMLLLSED